MFNQFYFKEQFLLVFGGLSRHKIWYIILIRDHLI